MIILRLHVQPKQHGFSLKQLYLCETSTVTKEVLRVIKQLSRPRSIRFLRVTKQLSRPRSIQKIGIYSVVLFCEQKKLKTMEGSFCHLLGEPPFYVTETTNKTVTN